MHVTYSKIIFCNVRYKILVQEDSVYNILQHSTISIYKMMVDLHNIIEIANEDVIFQY
jgi:hypothetical protein